MSKNKKKGSFSAIRRIIEKQGSRVHFVGVGGVSMYSLARLCISNSLCVSGSDREKSIRTDTLESSGTKFYVGHSANNIDGCDIVVYSHAISPDNSELTAAVRQGILTVSRAEFLGALMTKYKFRIGISGTHGKSTTVAMLDSIFAYAMKNQTTLSGASLITGEPYRLGSNEMLIYEGCEYKDSFLRFSPNIMVALNLEYDHPDYFRDFSSLKDSFFKAFMRSEEIIYNYDDRNLRPLINDLKEKRPAISFGQSERSDYKYSIISFYENGYRFALFHKGELIGNFEINLFGAFNVTNAVAAAVTAIRMGISPKEVRLSLQSFRGIPMRLQPVGTRGVRAVYRDYAHHPTEIRAVLNSLKIHLKDELTVVFKPHTYSRTKALFDEFLQALSIADYVIITDIYAAREEPIPGINSARLVKEIGEKAIYSEDEKVALTVDLQTRGTIVLMGAGNMDKIMESIV